MVFNIAESGKYTHLWCLTLQNQENILIYGVKHCRIRKIYSFMELNIAESGKYTHLWS